MGELTGAISAARGRVELRHLRAFVVVAEELNFSRAADRLHLAQQSLSAQIGRLEQELGVQLFRRTTRRVELSDAGAVLLTHARSILDAVDAACEETRRAGLGESGRLSISYTPTLAAETLPCLVTELHRRHPGVVLQMCEMWQAESVDAVRSGRFDVGMARCPELTDDLAGLRLRDEPLGVVLGATHALAGRERVGLSDLARTTLAIWPRRLSPGFYDLVLDFLRACGFAGTIQEFEYLTSAVFHSDPAARHEIAGGRAFSVAFATQFDPVPDGFVWRPVEPAPRVPVQLFWRAGASAVTQNFLALARDVAQAQGWLVRPPAGRAPVRPRSAAAGPR